MTQFATACPPEPLGQLALSVMLHILKTAFALILNLGWVLPFYLSMSSLIDWCRLEASPVVYGTDRGVHSFPFLSSSRQMLIVACIWIAVAIAWNTIRASIARKANRA